MELKSILESLFFVSGRPLEIREIHEAFVNVPEGPQPSREELQEALKQLDEEWKARGGGIQFVSIAQGHEFRSSPECAPWIKALTRPKPHKLSVSAVETLSFIAYRQPVTRAEIESTRGVDSGGVLKNLVERRLIRIVGRKEEAGRPLLYATSKEFLELFGLKDLSDLPPLREFEEMIKSQMIEEKVQEELTVMDLISTEETISYEENDRDVIDELDESLKHLREIEKITAPVPTVEETVPQPFPVS